MNTTVIRQHKEMSKIEFFSGEIDISCANLCTPYEIIATLRNGLRIYPTCEMTSQAHPQGPCWTQVTLVCMSSLRPSLLRNHQIYSQLIHTPLILLLAYMPQFNKGKQHSKRKYQSVTKISIYLCELFVDSIKDCLY